MQEYFNEEEYFDDDLLIMQEYYERTRNDVMEWELAEVCYDTAFENDYR